MRRNGRPFLWFINALRRFSAGNAGMFNTKTYDSITFFGTIIGPAFLMAAKNSNYVNNYVVAGGIII